VKVGKASGRELTGAEIWWGEAPEQPLMFAKQAAGFDYVVSKVYSLPSRWRSVMQRKCV